MKKNLYTLVSACLLTTACELETSHNGDLDGLWQLRAADTLATGGTTDLRGAQTWWAFQGDIVHMHDSVAAHADVVGHFTHSGTTLTLYDLCFSIREEGDMKVVDAGALHEMGLHRLDEDMCVVKLNSSEMQLETERLRLHFRKY